MSTHNNRNGARLLLSRLKERLKAKKSRTIVTPAPLSLGVMGDSSMAMTTAEQTPLQQEIRLHRHISSVPAEFVDPSILLSLAVRQRQTFVLTGQMPKVTEISTLRLAIFRQFELAYGSDRGTEDAEEEAKRDAMPRTPADYGFNLESVDLVGFDDAARMAALVRHATDYDAQWYWQKSGFLVLDEPAQARDGDNGAFHTCCADFTRLIAVETLNPASLYHHLEKSLHWDVLSAVRASYETYAATDIARITSLLMDEVYRRTNTPEEQRHTPDNSHRDTDRILALARHALDEPMFDEDDWNA